jgi:multimeric flavodoxin WrbA
MTFSLWHEKKKDGPLNALFLNCTLTSGPEVSNTEALSNMVIQRMKELEPDLEAEIVRVRDYDIGYGPVNDAGDGDQWPEILEKIKRCNIFVMATPIWMGTRSSVCQQVIERLDGSTKTVMCEKTGQFPLYGSVGGMVVTGNEDGAHDCIAYTLSNLLHFGVTCPPNTDVYWVGDAGPGPSFVEAGGAMSPYVRRNVELTAQNLIQGAKIMRDNPYEINIAEQNKKMMQRNEIKMDGMKLAMKHMKENMPD